jgi:hypothetical protein
VPFSEPVELTTSTKVVLGNSGWMYSVRMRLSPNR